MYFKTVLLCILNFGLSKNVICQNEVFNNKTVNSFIHNLTRYYDPSLERFFNDDSTKIIKKKEEVQKYIYDKMYFHYCKRIKYKYDVKNKITITIFEYTDNTICDLVFQNLVDGEVITSIMLSYYYGIIYKENNQLIMYSESTYSEREMANVVFKLKGEKIQQYVRYHNEKSHTYYDNGKIINYD